MARLFHEQALQRDANYAPAHAGLAETYRLLSYFGGLPPSQGSPQGKACALRAIELDDTLPEAHVTLANLLYLYDWDWAGAEREFLWALELSPQSSEAHCWYGFFLWARLRNDESLAELQKAVELDPFSPLANWWLAWPLFSTDRCEEALAIGRKLLNMDPNFWGGHWTIAVGKWRRGTKVEATEDYAKGAALEAAR